VKFAEYKDRFQTIAMQRDGGVLDFRFHTDGDSLQWGLLAHAEAAEAFGYVARDPENRVMVMTGTGELFSGPRGTPATAPQATAESWEHIRSTGGHLLRSFLDIEAVVISAVNGPAYRHAELPLLGDIVLASETAAFQDSGHLPSRLTPGDGMHFVMPLLLGLNRGRYFLLTGQTIEAAEAKDLGLVAEVLPREQLLDRAHELAAQLVEHNPLLLRYTRVLMTEWLRQMTQSLHPLGLALEGLAAVDETLRAGQGE
jgi:enoyl-CoA hydratase/carnithine racemase